LQTIVNVFGQQADAVSISSRVPNDHNETAISLLMGEILLIFYLYGGT